MYDARTLQRISQHVDNGESIPSHLVRLLKAGKNHMAATMMMRQLQFAQLDMELHNRISDAQSTSEDFLRIQDKVALDFAADKPYPGNKFICSFSHIFAGGYAAGYYSYKVSVTYPTFSPLPIVTVIYFIPVGRSFGS